MRSDLTVEQWASVDVGWLEAPDGGRYQRRSTRMRRQQVDDLLAAGAPLVLYWYGGEQLTWFGGTDVAPAWDVARTRRSASTPKPDGDVVWTAGEWVCDDKSLVLLTGRC